MGAFADIAGYLLQTAFSLLLLLLLLRLLLQLARADYYNPLSQFLVRATNPLIAPLRRVVPAMRRIDGATLALLLLVQAASIASLLLLAGRAPPNPLLLLLWSAVSLAALTLQFYFFALLAVIILSWVAPGASHPAAHLLYQLTAPVMAPFRRLLPPMGGLDLSPILLFIAINVLQILLRHTALGLGLHPSLAAGL